MTGLLWRGLQARSYSVCHHHTLHLLVHYVLAQKDVVSVRQPLHSLMLYLLVQRKLELAALRQALHLLILGLPAHAVSVWV